jgi:hypothetical protein
VASEVAKVLASLRGLFTSDDSPQPNIELKSIQGPMSDAEIDDGWESGSLDENAKTTQDTNIRPTETRIRQANKGSDLDTKLHKAQKLKRKEDSSHESDSASISSKSDQSGTESESRSQNTGELTGPDEPGSSFLPSLSMGYLPGDPDDSDWSGEEDTADIDPAPRKNRRGQRARKA